MTRKTALARWLLTMITYLLLSPQLSAEPQLRLFTARYRVTFHGLSGGTLELTLKKGDQPGQYVYTSSAKPSLLASFMVSSDARETSLMELTATGIRPLKFISEDGKKGDSKDSALDFDWTRQRLTGRAEAKDIDIELPARTQDHLSIQIAVIWDLLQGREPGVYSLIDGDEIKEYEYRNDGTATIKYGGRDLESVRIRSARTGGSDRITHYWHAPEFGYVPVRAERATKGQVDLVMQLVDLKFAD